ncbi:DUF305 domain-containing protein [Nocardia sp. NRRL S-836]|uniref:DUF305 domain-containing protein n=1 Tax=Nocardia sp. NRRL S-836 TaxID=1519492 RepID=UPI0006AEF818|nr:DUF305 domain-containing protein [Nocardia sp. NRRL S-836]KOV82456.1 hypothetical protein ADL03_24350 [Nocardia sp. NRRL S-836]
MKRKSLIGLGVAAVALLAGCGGNDMAGTHAMTTTAPPAVSGRQDGHNEQDVEFARAMIEHHRQALDMAAVVPGKSTNPAVTELGKRIAAAQAPEIEKMTGWLAKWGAAPAPTSMPGMDHGSGHGSMPGMMTAEEMAKLNGATGAEFDRAWLEMMIKHHEGAVEMAEAEQEKGASAEARKLAEEVAEAQRAEITEMRNLLKQG